MNINNLKRLEYIVCKIRYSYYVSFLRHSSNASRRNIKIENENKHLSEDFIPNTILNKNIKTPQDWENVREELLSSNKQISLKTVDSVILSVCISSKNYNLGFTYIDFLKQQNTSLGLAAIGKYFKLFYLANRNNLVIENEDEIYSLYKALRAQYKVFDNSTCDNIIHALSITRQWRECLKLLEESKLTYTADKDTCSVIAAAAFRNQELDLGWKLLNKCIDLGHLPVSVAYLSYIKLAERSHNPLEQMEELFNFFRLYDIECDNEVTNSIIDLYHKLKLDAIHLKFHYSAKCKNCGVLLTKWELSETNFEELKSAIFSNVIVGSNVFYKSTPKELEQFKQFTSNMKKYDVVIDGLNVAYSVGTKQSPHVLSFFVKSVVKHFVDQNKTVLLLGRTHMQRWSQIHWSYIKEHSDTFLAQSLSQDDPYLLYCALQCGVNTIIVSRDLMRSHLFKLSNFKLKVLFNRWLLQNQYRVSHINKEGKVYFKYPPPFARTAQKLNEVWHIPSCTLSDSGENSNMWLCLNNKPF